MKQPNANPAKTLPLQLVLVVPFVLQIFATVGLTGYLSLRNGQKAVNDVSSQLRQQMSARINLQVLTYLEKPYIVGQTIVVAAEENQLDLTDLTKLERSFWRLVSQDTVEFVNLSLADGSAISVEETPQGNITSRNGYKENPSQRKVYLLDERCQRKGPVETITNFDHRTRFWYKIAKQTGRPIWISQPYFSQIYKLAVISLTQPIYSRDREFLGVQNSIFRIEKIYNFLKTLKVGQTGQTFIIDRAGNLIASSAIENPYIIDLKNNTLQPIPAIKSDSPIISATARAILDRFGNFNAISQSHQLDFMLGDRRQFVQVSTIKDERGIIG
ncbi:MAG: hypothetical protein MUE44_19815 [Oscillatoriaceae cyanobacterium Prado104]|jgi:hypothetical protein|nr:hypothetical protein [Oscillatoriaceae cyanobacterium Prado104]